MNLNTKPNFLFLFPDQHRGDWLPFDKKIFDKNKTGNLPVKMPNLKKLMKMGVTFTRCITPSPLCAPSRACLASGLRYRNCKVYDNSMDYPEEMKTFYSKLKQIGYCVGGVGKFDVHKGTQWWGHKGRVDLHEKMGFTHSVDNEGKWDAVNSGKQKPKGPYMKYLYDNNLAKIHINDMKSRHKLNTDATDLPDKAYCDNWLTQNGLDMLRSFPDNKPWFLQVNFTGPHSPWDITKSMKETFKDVKFPPANCCDLYDNSRINEVRQNYAAMLYNIDRNIGLLLDEIDKRGELDNTIIVYSSDHGEMLGDKNVFGKSIPDRGSVHIPLVISGAGIKRNTVSEELVELQDLTSTFIDLAGTDMQEAKNSKSLVPLLKGTKIKHREYVISALNGGEKYGKPKESWQLITDSKYKLVCLNEKLKFLYNIKKDPWENNNVINTNKKYALKLSEQLKKEQLS